MPEAKTTVKQNVLQMIKGVYDQMAAVHTERAEAVAVLASASAQESSVEEEGEDDDLDVVDADEDEEYEPFLREQSSILPLIE